MGLHLAFHVLLFQCFLLRFGLGGERLMQGFLRGGARSSKRVIVTFIAIC
jgi:hypothetical protein